MSKYVNCTNCEITKYLLRKFNMIGYFKEEEYGEGEGYLFIL